VVEKSLGLKSVLESRYALDVTSLAFDGNSCFEGLHSRTSADLCSQLDICDPGLPNLYTEHLVICDPLHLMKRIRYPWVHSTFSIGFGSEEDIMFSLASI
jgi:hypothetical protein